MSDPKPTVGRIVHFTPRANQDPGPDPWAAMVTRVHSDSVVNLTVFPPAGTPAPETQVELGAGPRTWRWPPRQKV
jgi:hypothetical protein